MPDGPPSADRRTPLGHPSQSSSPHKCTSHLGFSLETPENSPIDEPLTYPVKTTLVKTASDKRPKHQRQGQGRDLTHHSPQPHSDKPTPLENLNPRGFCAHSLWWICSSLTNFRGIVVKYLRSLTITWRTIGEIPMLAASYGRDDPEAPASVLESDATLNTPLEGNSSSYPG